MFTDFTAAKTEKFDLARLHKLSAGVALEIGCAEDTARDFYYKLSGWQYARDEMSRIVRKLERAYGDFAILVRDLKAELAVEEAERRGA